jgi:hypothetical protein
MIGLIRTRVSEQGGECVDFITLEPRKGDAEGVSVCRIEDLDDEQLLMLRRMLAEEKARRSGGVIH